MSLKGYVLAVDTQVCESFASQLEQVFNLYAAIQEWTLSEQKKSQRLAERPSGRPAPSRAF